MNENEKMNVAERDIKVSRIIDAPRELVFNAYFDADNISKWWGPKGFTTTVYQMDAKPGGIWRHTMHGPDGTDYPNYVVYKEIKKPEYIKYTNGSAENSDDTFEAEVHFEEVGDNTRVTMHLIFASAKVRQEMIKFGALEGGIETLERLSELLEKKQVAL